MTSNLRTQKFGIYCTWIFTILTIIGWLGIAHFYLPARADLGLEATKIWFYEDHRWGVLIGCTLFYIGAGLLVPGSIQFGFMLARAEGERPLWSLTTAVCGIIISLIIFFNCCAWMISAYRAETGADVVQAFSDWAWLAFLLGWFYLALEMFSSSMAELGDQRENPMVPRWFSWMTMAGAITLMTAAGPAFMQSGPFAYHGLLGFYLPMVIWGLYLNGTAWFMYRELQREAAAGN